MLAAVAIIINNYFHDLAAGVLFGAAVAMWAVARAAGGMKGPGLEALRRVYPALSKLALGAVIWIIVGGIPRTIFFSRYEWDPAVTRGIVPALVVKHVLFFAAVVVGVVMWRRMKAALSRRGGTDGAGGDTT